MSIFSILVIVVVVYLLLVKPVITNMHGIGPGRPLQKQETARILRAIYIVAGEIAHADGRESAEELNAIVKLVRSVLGNPDIPATRILEDYRKYSSTPWTKADAAGLSTAFKIVIVEVAISVALSDSVATDAERDKIIHIAQTLDLPDFVIQQLLGKLAAGSRGGQSFSQAGGQVNAAELAYQTLGLQRGATQKEIKRRYQKLAMQHHPDRAPEGRREEATEKFKEIGDAYKILKAVA